MSGCRILLKLLRLCRQQRHGITAAYSIVSAAEGLPRHDVVEVYLGYHNKKVAKWLKQNTPQPKGPHHEYP